MRRSIALSGAFSLIVMTIGVLQALGQGSARAAGWAPDRAVLKQLGPAVAVEKYTLRVPKGYEMQQCANAPAGVRVCGWTGAARSDGTKPSLTMNMVTLPRAEQEKYKNISLEQLAERMIGGIKRQRANWKQEKTETGVINGMDFARIRWEGTEPRNQWEMRGFIYIARDGDNIIQLASQDMAAASERALPLAEASILTFKKK